MGKEYFFVVGGISFIHTSGVLDASEYWIVYTFEAAVPNVFDVAGLI
jgi:hypothetical protein